MPTNCEHCGGCGILNANALPPEILTSDPRDFERAAVHWIYEHPESEAEICSTCLYGRMEDFGRVMKNRLFQKGGLAAVRKFELRCRTCRHCGYVAEQSMADCPICGKLNMGARA